MSAIGPFDRQWLIEHFGSDDLEMVNQTTKDFFQKWSQRNSRDYWRTHRPIFQPSSVQVIESWGNNLDEALHLAKILMKSREVPLQDKAKIIDFVRCSTLEPEKIRAVSSTITVVVGQREFNISYRVAAHCHWLCETHDDIDPPYILLLPAGTGVEDFENFLKTITSEGEASEVETDLAGYLRIMSIADWIGYDWLSDSGGNLLPWFDTMLSPKVPTTLQGQLEDLRTILNSQCPLSLAIADNLLSKRISKYIQAALTSGQELAAIVEDLTPFQSLFENRTLKIALPATLAHHLAPLFTAGARVTFL